MYSYAYQKPLIVTDPNGESATLAGALIGGAIGGGVALWRGEDLSHVLGAAAQGAIAGAIIGSVIDTGGASLGVMVAAGAGGNVVGGIVGRAISGDKQTGSAIALDAAIGGGGALVGAAAGNVLKSELNGLSRIAKGQVGEAITEMKYAAKGYLSQGKAVVPTGGRTPTGRVEVARYDHDLKNVITGKKLTVESKFNTSRLSDNQVAAQGNVTTPGGLIVDRTTSGQLGNAANVSISSGIIGGSQ
jgi:hypothetical protein